MQNLITEEELMAIDQKITQDLYKRVLALYEEAMGNEGLIIIEPLCESIGLDMEKVRVNDPEERNKYKFFSTAFKALLPIIINNSEAVFGDIKAYVQSYMEYYMTYAHVTSTEGLTDEKADLLYLTSSKLVGVKIRDVQLFKTYEKTLSAHHGYCRSVRESLNQKGEMEEFYLVLASMGVPVDVIVTTTDVILAHLIACTWLDSKDLYTIETYGQHILDDIKMDEALSQVSISGTHQNQASRALSDEASVKVASDSSSTNAKIASEGGPVSQELMNLLIHSKRPEYLN
jgi:hypothetical protein